MFILRTVWGVTFYSQVESICMAASFHHIIFWELTVRLNGNNTKLIQILIMSLKNHPNLHFANVISLLLYYICIILFTNNIKTQVVPEMIFPDFLLPRYPYRHHRYQSLQNIHGWWQIILQPLLVIYNSDNETKVWKY